MNIVICDDDQQLLSIINTRVRDLLIKSSYSDFNYNISVFNNSALALKYCLNNEIGIVLLDIDMPGMNGFDIAEILKQRYKNVIIIFISNFDNYVYTSLKFRPFRFIRKSHMQEELSEALYSALNEILFNNEFIVLGNKYFNEKIFISTILYFESKRNYVEIVCANGKRYLYRDSIKNLEKQYSSYKFIRIHSGFLVNMKSIKRIYKSAALLEDGTELNVSRTYLNNVRNEYAKYIRE